MRGFVTIVSGVPRSGTSLLMQMLAAGGMPLLADEVRAADEDNPRGYYEYAPVMASARDASWFDEARGRAVKVIHTLLPRLPEGDQVRVILMRRDLSEVLRSQQKMLARRGGAPLEEKGLAAVFEAQLTRAREWAIERPRTALLDLDYAVVIGDPAAAARRLDAFLGGGLDVAAMAACVDPALYRSR